MPKKWVFSKIVVVDSFEMQETKYKLYVLIGSKGCAGLNAVRGVGCIVFLRGVKGGGKFWML